MILSSLDGVYLICPRDVELEGIHFPDSVDFGIHTVEPSTVAVTTFNQSDDERVELQVEYWNDGEPPGMSRWTQGWDRAEKVNVATSSGLVVTNLEGEDVVEVTRVGGSYTIVVLARWVGNVGRDPEDPPEEHVLHCWPNREDPWS